MTRDASPHHARYEYHGRTIHLCIETLADLDRVLELSDVHWLATTAPVSDFLLPLDFLQLLDQDDDGRIRVEEVKSAIRWLRAATARERPGHSLRPEELTSDALVTGLSKLRRAFALETEQLDLDTLRDLRRRYEEDPIACGSGAVLPETVDAPDQRELLKAVQLCIKPDTEPVTEEQLDQFTAQAAQLVEWRESSPGEDIWADQLPVYEALAGPLEHYFLMADASLFSGHRPDLVLPESLGTEDVRGALRAMPLAQPLNAEALDFESHINPLYAGQVESFRKTFLRPDEKVLSRESFEELKSRFDIFGEWLGAAPETELKRYQTARLKAWLEQKPLLAAVRDLLRKKRESGLVLQDLDNLEKLLLLQAHLVNFCRNFVAFPDLYNPKARALFERGTLVMDGREFHLSLPVNDIQQHKQAAVRSHMFVLYVQVDAETIAVPVTSGSKGLLAVEKRGIFSHVDGTEREARVVDLVSNPISLWEALLAPFEKIGRSLKEKVESLSAERERELIVSTIAASRPRGKEKPSGTLLAGGGVAVAALGSSLAFILKTLSTLTLPTILLGLLGLFLLFMVPATAVAFFKLRNRDLSSVLEGNTWGINARMKLTGSQARQFTRSPSHPGGPAGTLGKLLAFALFVMAGCLAYFFRDELVALLISLP